MGRPKKTPVQKDKLEKARDAKVYQADSLLQKGRFELSLIEQRLILYAITKIRPTDTKFKEYTWWLKDFYDICGMRDESYTEVKKILGGLRDKSWWILMEDPNEPGEECESKVCWFDIVRINKKSGKVTIAFHPDMVKFLLELSRQFEDRGAFYTQYTLRYVLPMRSQYSTRLYQLLKPYQKNNMEWWFKLDELKRLLDCQRYGRYADFRLRVLEPAVKEINKYSDINIRYEIRDKEGKRITELTFYMTEKSNAERVEAQRIGLTALDGNVHHWDNPSILKGQLNFLGLEDSDEDS